MQNYVYKNPNHVIILENRGSQDSRFDVIIKLDDGEIYAHKNILTTNLQYFKRMFSNFRESNQGNILMQDLVKADLQPILEYAYYGEILLTDSNALNLLELSNYLGEEDIEKACVEFLKKHLKLDDAFRAYEFSIVVDHKSLKEVAKLRILLNFPRCWQTTEYLNLNFENLKDILSLAKSDFAESQKIFFEGIVRWIMYSIESRRYLVKDLLRLIDITQLAPVYLKSYFKNRADHEIIHGIIKEIHEENCLSQTLMIFGTSDDFKLSCQFFNFTEKYWSPPQQIADNDHQIYSNSAILNDECYFISSLPNSVRCYLIILNLTSLQCIMLHPPQGISILRNAAMATCSRFLYLCGGVKEDKSISDQVLKYDPETKSFETLAPMGTNRWGAAAIFLSRIPSRFGRVQWKKLPQFGIGSSITKVLLLKLQIEKYDPTIEGWMTLPYLCKTSRCQQAVAALNGKMYAFGGFALNTVEVYDPLINGWRFVASMKMKRDCFLMVARKEKLFAIGGNWSENTVEVYDPSEDKWQINDEMSLGLRIKNPRGHLIASSNFTTSG